jgi:hypothetical protein
MGGLPLLRPRSHLAAVPVKIEQRARALGLTPCRPVLCDRRRRCSVILLNPNVGRFVKEVREVAVSHGPGRRQ